MKKILIIHETMNGGGAEKVLCDILNNFNYSEYQIDLLLDYKTGIYLNSIPPKVNVLAIHNSNKTIFEKIFFHNKSILEVKLKHRLKRVLRNKEYDVIISFMEGPSAKYHSLIRHRAPKNLTWIHTNIEKNHWSGKYWKNFDEERKFYQSIDKVLCVSSHAKKTADCFFNLPNNSQVLYNLIDRDAIRKNATIDNITTSKFTICNVGRLTLQKRQDRIIQVAKILKNRGHDFDFWILGTGTLEQQLKHEANKNGVDDIVKFLGYKNNPYPYMNKADIFLLTSDAEGYPTVICEALCLGKPIVSTDVTGVYELLSNQAGVITTFSPENIANDIEQLFTDKELLETYSRNALTRSNEFDKAAVMNNIYALLQ